MSSLFGKFLTILGLKKREANILVVGLDNSGKSTILNYLKRKEDQVDEVVPTVGFTVEKLSGVDRKSGISLTAFDMSGQGRYRNLWEHYYSNVEAIIFVVDSTDALRLVVARDELEMLLRHQQLQLQNNNNNNNNNNGDDGNSEYANDSSNGTTNGANENNGGSDESDQQHKSSTNSNHQSNANHQRKVDIPILFFANKMDLKDSLPSVKISQMLGLTNFPHKQWHIQASNAITGEGVADGIEWLIHQIAKNKKQSPPTNSLQNSSSSSNSFRKSTSSNALSSAVSMSK